MANLVKRDDGTFRLDNVRLSYPHLFHAWAGEAEEGKQQQKKFSASFLIPLATHKADIVMLRNECIALAKTELKMVLPNDKLCVRNGSGSGKPEQEGHWLLKASEQKRPAVVGKGNVPITEEDGVIYAGCFVSVNFRLWAQSNKFGKRINANLLAVRFLRDGEALSETGPRPEVGDVFGGFDEEDDGLGGDGLGDDDGLGL